MKIVKRGVDPYTIEHRFKCKHCNTIFDAVRSECTDASDRDGVALRYKCPVCERDCYSYPEARQHSAHRA